MSRIVLLKNDTGGEGSRGGHVIGHTSTGKPVYANHKHKSHGGFTPEEHKQAANLHEKKAKELRATADQYHKEGTAAGLAHQISGLAREHSVSAGMHRGWAKGEK